MEELSTTSSVEKRIIDDTNHVTRQEATRQACLAAGINWPKTILPEGTSLYQSGVDKLRADRALWARLPDARLGIEVVTAALKAEVREDYAMTVSKLRLRPDSGRIVSEAQLLNPKVPGLGYSPHSFRQLAQQVPGLNAASAPRGMTSALLYLTDSERAEIVNARIGRATTDVTLRTKLSHNGARIARGVLSTKYADCNDIHVGEAIAQALNGRGATMKLAYRPGDAQSAFEIIFPSELPIKLFRVGDVHRATIIVRNSETGEGSLRVIPAVMRAACANLTISTGEGVITSMIHLGDPTNLKNKLRAALLAAEAQIAPLVAAIQRSAETPLAYEAGDIITKLAKALAIQTDRAKAWKETYEAKYLPEGGATLWSLTSAITDAAQNAENWVAQEREERVAARVIAENGFEWLNKKVSLEF